MITEIEDASVVVSGEPGSESCSIQIAVNTETITYKEAIVNSRAGWVGLHCLETPDVWFVDIIRVPMDVTTRAVPLDPLFLDACEPGSLVVTGAVPSRPVRVGASVVGDEVHLASDLPAGHVTLTVAGIRRGTTGRRFPRHSESEMEANRHFWGLAQPGGLS